MSAHVLMHRHLDHMGSSHAVCWARDVRLLYGEGERVAWRPQPVTTGRTCRYRSASNTDCLPGHPVDSVLREGDEIAGFIVLEVAGDLPGHLAFWRQETVFLVAGDVLFNLDIIGTGRKKLQLPPQMRTGDPAMNLESARRVAALKPSLVCFGHGPPVSGERFCEFVASARFSK